MRVFITGISGFLGQALALSLRARGHDVCGSVRTAAQQLQLQQQAIPTVMHEMPDPASPEMFRGVGVVIHGAYSFGRGSREINQIGTGRLVEAATKAGVAKQVFISSYSAHPLAPSEYGRSKWAIERACLEAGMTIVRPGLVVGYGGLFLTSLRVLQKLPIMPMIRGPQEMALLGLDDFNRAMAAIITQESGGILRLYLEKRVPMEDFVKAIRQAIGSRALLLPLPYALVYPPVWLLERLNLPAPISTENLKGLQANQQVTDPSDLTAFIDSPMSMEEMIDAAILPGANRSNE